MRLEVRLLARPQAEERFQSGRRASRRRRAAASHGVKNRSARPISSENGRTRSKSTPISQRPVRANSGHAVRVRHVEAERRRVRGQPRLAPRRLREPHLARLHAETFRQQQAQHRAGDDELVPRRLMAEALGPLALGVARGSGTVRRPRRRGGPGRRPRRGPRPRPAETRRGRSASPGASPVTGGLALMSTAPERFCDPNRTTRPSVTATAWLGSVTFSRSGPMVTPPPWTWRRASLLLLARFSSTSSLRHAYFTIDQVGRPYGYFGDFRSDLGRWENCFSHSAWAWAAASAP